MRTRAIAACLLLAMLTACATMIPFAEHEHLSRIAGEKPEVTDAEMDELLDLWRKYEMPEPPADAQLVMLTLDSNSTTNGRKDPPEFYLAWRLNPEGAPRLSLLLGTIDAEMDKPDGVEAVDAADVNVDNLRYRRFYFGRVFRYSEDFALGVQLWSRGHKVLGRWHVAQAVGTRYSTVRDQVRQPYGESARDTLGGAVWGYWFNKSLRVDSDRRIIAAKLKLAIDDFDCLRPDDDDWRPDEYQRLLSALEAALVPSKAEPGSIQYMIDSLVDVAQHLSDWGFPWFAWDDDSEVPPALREIVLHGFDAIPLLIDHLDDCRLTRCVYCPWINGMPGPVSVGRLARLLVRALANEDVSPDWVECAETGEYKPSYRKLHKWWEGANVIGEAEYLARALLAGLLPGRGLSSELRVQARVLAARHPLRMAEVFEAALQRDGAGTHILIEPLAASELADETKLRLLVAGCSHENRTVRLDSLRALAGVDPERYEAILTERIKITDGKLDRRSPYNSDAIQYTELAKLSESDEVWAALEALAGRAEPALRIRMLGRFGVGDDKPPYSTRWLTFLAGHLTDKDTRVFDTRVTECDPASKWEVISIGNFAAMRLGKLLELDGTPEPDWTEVQWTAHHTRVADALIARGIKAGR